MDPKPTTFQVIDGQSPFHTCSTVAEAEAVKALLKEKHPNNSYYILLVPHRTIK